MPGSDSSELRELRVGIALSELGRVTLRPTARAVGPTRGRLEVLSDALSLALDTKVRGQPCELYTDLLAELHWGTLHFAWLPPMIALRAVSRGSATPLVAPVRAGSAWYWTALFVPEDSGVQRIEDLRRARVAWVDHMSSAGYLVIRASLRAQGFDLEKLFGEEQFLASHDAVAQAVASGRADVGATYAHFDDSGRVRSSGWGRAPMRVLKFAGPIPGDVLAASVHLPPELSAAMKEAFLGEGHAEVKRAADDLFNAVGFEEVTRDHLRHLENLLNYVEIPG